MNELMLQLGDILIKDIEKHVDNYSDEVVLSACALIRKMRSQLFQTQISLEGRMIERMMADDSTKTQFLNIDGENKIATLKRGAMKCEDKEADMKYKDAGFDPLEIGRYIFEPRWAKAKEALKFGGEKKKILEKLFQEGKKSIEIK